MPFLWISPASVLQLFFPRGLLFFHSLLQFWWVTWQNRRIFCFCLRPLACSAPRSHRDAPWGGRLPFSTHFKVWFFGSVERLILVCGFPRLSVFLLYTWCAQGVWYHAESAHSYSPDILSSWGAHCTEACKSISVKKIHLSQWVLKWPSQEAVSRT